MNETETLNPPAVEAFLGSIRVVGPEVIAREEARERAARVRSLREECGAPSRVVRWLRERGYEGAAWPLSPESAPVQTWRRRYDRLLNLAERRDGATLGICGPEGTGKTTMAVALMWAATAALKTVRHVDLSWLLIEVADARPSGRLSEVLHGFIQPRVLVIDEVDRRAVRWGHFHALETIVQDRAKAGRVTVLVGDESPEEFSKVAGEIVCRRIDRGGGVVTADWAPFE